MFYEKLADAVQSGHLILTTIDGLPRSSSNALGIAAAHGEKVAGQINRPFADVAAGFEHGAQKVYQRAVELGLEEESRSRPVHLLVKETARRISYQKDWEQWLKLNHAIIFVVRDPHLQFQSLIERLANDLMVKWGAARLSFVEAMDYLERVDNLLREGGEVGSLQVLPQYHLASWSAIQKHKNVLESAVAKGLKIKSAIVASNVLRLDPYKTMRQIAKVADLGFTKKMVCGWNESPSSLVNLTLTAKDDDLSTNAWISRALNSHSFSLPERRALSLAQLPDRMREYIETVAIPTYIDFLSSSALVGATDFKTVNSLINQPVRPNISFQDLNPPAAYALASTAALRQGEPESNSRLWERVQSSLRQKHGSSYSASFVAIDRAIAQRRRW